MKHVNTHHVPEHGLQIEETLAAGDREGVAHLAHYWWAWTVAHREFNMGIARAAPWVGWDLGCGCGYGAVILAEQHDARVVGFDADKTALATAARDYADPHVRYEHAELDGIWPVTMEHGVVDVVTCFGLLEHLRHREFFMEQLVERLKPKSVVTLNVGDPKRPHPNPSPVHANFLYDRDTLARFLARYFGEVEFGLAGRHVADPAGVFAYYNQLNPQVKQAALLPELLVLGNDVVYCADPKR